MRNNWVCELGSHWFNDIDEPKDFDVRFCIKCHKQQTYHAGYRAGWIHSASRYAKNKKVDRWAAGISK